MNKQDIYTDFYFNGKKLSDFGGVIVGQYENMRSLTPSQDIETKSIVGMDGEIPISSKYSSRTWTENVLFEKMVNIREISSWISSKQDADFYYINDDVKIKARVPDEINFEMCSGDKNGEYTGLLSIPFIAYDPYYYLITPLSHEFSTVGIKRFDNVGNVEAMTVITFQIVGTQSIKFSMNNKNYELKNMTDWCEIDTRKRTVKDSKGNQRMNFSSDGDKIAKFPMLVKGENVFELKQGNIRNVKIECNCRFI